MRTKDYKLRINTLGVVKIMRAVAVNKLCFSRWSKYKVQEPSVQNNSSVTLILERTLELVSP